jgi:excisionase family DNA binding protein
MGIDTKYLSTRKVAERLGVSVMSISRWVKSGKLIGYKFGKTIRISEDDLSQFVKKSQIAKTSNDEETDKSDFSTGKSVLKHWGTWVGPKDEYYKILEEIKESRSDAEF